MFECFHKGLWLSLMPVAVSSPAGELDALASMVSDSNKRLDAVNRINQHFIHHHR